MLERTSEWETRDLVTKITIIRTPVVLVHRVHLVHGRVERAAVVLQRHRAAVTVRAQLVAMTVVEHFG